MLNITSLNKLQQQNPKSKSKENEQVNNISIENNDQTPKLNNFEVGQSIKSSRLVSFNGVSLNELSWDDGAEKVSSSRPKRKPVQQTSEQEAKTLSWDDGAEKVSSSRPKRKPEKDYDTNELSAEEQLEIKKQKARDAYIDRQIAREKRENFFRTLKAGFFGSVLAAGGIAVAPYVPTIQKKAAQLSDAVELVSNPQCIAPSISEGELLVPTPPEFLKGEGDTTPDPYNLKTTNVCISKTNIEQLELKQKLIKSKDQYLQLSQEEIQAFNQMKAHSSSYLQVDHQGNKESFIAFLPKDIKMPDGRVLPQGTIFFETFINRGVNNSKKVDLIGYIDPNTGFINNIEKDLIKNMPKEFQPNSLDGLQETNNAAKQINERVKTLISRYNNKDNPDISDTIIPEPYNNSFFKVQSYDLNVLDQTLLSNNKSTIIYKNTDGSVNMIFGKAAEKDTSIKAKINELFSNNTGSIFKEFTSKIKYVFAFAESGTVIPETLDFNSPEAQSVFNNKIKSFVFVTDDGSIGIISKDGIYIPPLNTIDFNKDSFAEMISIKEQIHEMRQNIFKEGNSSQFSQLIEGSSNVTAINNLNSFSLPTSLNPNQLTALNATFIGNNTMTLKNAGNVDILSMQKHRDFDTKIITYDFSVNPLGNKIFTGSINENGQIKFNNPEATQFEMDTVKRRISTLIEAAKTGAPNVVITKTQAITQTK